MEADTEARLIELQMAFGRAIRDPHEQVLIANVSDRQLSIYRELFWNNFQTVISSAAPVAQAVLPDNSWTELLHTFWRDYRAKTPEYTQLPFEFAEWLRTEAGNWKNSWPWLGDLVTWEIAELAAMFAEDGTTPMSGVALHPSVQLLAFNWPVHRLSTSWVPESPLPTFLSCYRTASDGIDFIELTPLSAALLDLIQQNPQQSPTTYTTQLAAMLHQDRNELASAVQPLISVVTERGLLLWGPDSEPPSLA